MKVKISCKILRWLYCIGQNLLVIQEKMSTNPFVKMQSTRIEHTQCSQMKYFSLMSYLLYRCHFFFLFFFFASPTSHSGCMCKCLCVNRNLSLLPTLSHQNPFTLLGYSCKERRLSPHGWYSRSLSAERGVFPAASVNKSPPRWKCRHSSPRVSSAEIPCLYCGCC